MLGCLASKAQVCRKMFCESVSFLFALQHDYGCLQSTYCLVRVMPRIYQGISYCLPCENSFEILNSIYSDISLQSVLKCSSSIDIYLLLFKLMM